MTFDLAATLLIKPLVFAVAALPLVIDNLRTGQISNWNNTILLLGGLGILALGPTLGMSGFHLPAPSLWMLVALVPLAFFALGWVRGGAAKFLIALLPWFSSGEYLFVTISGLILAGVVALARRRKDTQIALPMVVIGLIVQAAGIAAGPH
jgi:Flp pilus assembly protein protease CpaA